MLFRSGVSEPGRRALDHIGRGCTRVTGSRSLTALALLAPHKDEEGHPDAGEENGGEIRERASAGVFGLHKGNG